MVADELVAREAAARGLTPQALLDQEIPKRVVTAPESAVLALYQSLGDRTRGAALEQMRPGLRAWLTRHTEPELAKMNYLEELTKLSTRAEVLLAAPRVRVERTSRDVVLGPEAAPVELVAFGDFQSLEYARLAQAFGKMRETFGDKVRLVFKHLPLSGPESAAAAEAGACANAQGKFWALHDAIIVQPGRLDADRLKRIAADVRLDRRVFDGCRDGGTFKNTIRQALDEAERYAVTASWRRRRRRSCHRSSSSSGSSRRNCCGFPRRTAAEHEPSSFVDADRLVGREILERLAPTGRPLDVDSGHARVVAEAEGQREIALRGVARAAVHRLPLRARRARHADEGADAAAVGARSDRPQA